MSALQTAQTVGLRALAWLAAQDDLLPMFLSSSGLTETDLREQADDPAVLGGVLDFVLMNDDWVIAFCEQERLPPEVLQGFRQALPGGAEVHWT